MQEGQRKRKQPDGKGELGRELPIDKKKSISQVARTFPVVFHPVHDEEDDSVLVQDIAAPDEMNLQDKTMEELKELVETLQDRLDTNKESVNAEVYWNTRVRPAFQAGNMVLSAYDHDFSELKLSEKKASQSDDQTFNVQDVKIIGLRYTKPDCFRCFYRDKDVSSIDWDEALTNAYENATEPIPESWAPILLTSLQRMSDSTLRVYLESDDADDGRWSDMDAGDSYSKTFNGIINMQLLVPIKWMPMEDTPEE